MDAAPSTDLIETLTKMREDYEAVTAKNRRDQEVWYQSTVHQTDRKNERCKTFSVQRCHQKVFE